MSERSTSADDYLIRVCRSDEFSRIHYIARRTSTGSGAWTARATTRQSRIAG